MKIIDPPRTKILIITPTGTTGRSAGKKKQIYMGKKTRKKLFCGTCGGRVLVNRQVFKCEKKWLGSIVLIKWAFFFPAL